MALTVEEIQIVVDAQVNGAVNGLERVETESQSMTRTLAKSAKFIAGAAVTGLIVKSFINIGKQSLKLASDAEETFNKYSVVFETVADEANAAATRIKDEFKLSDETTQNFLSGVGDITSGLGATSAEALKAAEDITALGLDINSFANLSGGAEQAVSALTSLFTGEREAAKALGIVINDTNLKAYAEDMGKVFKELTPLEKGFLSLELATTQSSLAIGDAARSSDSYAYTVKAAAEATKDLQAALGVSLLPTATEAVGIFSELASKMAEVVKEHNELQAIVGRFEAGNASAQDRVDIAQAEVVLLREQISKEREHLKILEGNDVTTQKIVDGQKEIVSGLIDELRLASNIASHYYQIVKAENELAEEEKKRAAAKAKADEDESARIAGLVNDTATRQKAQKDLGNTFAQIDEQVKAGLIDKNGEIEKEKALRETLLGLIESGFTAEGAGIANIKSAAESLGVTLTDVFSTGGDEAEAMAKRIEQAIEDTKTTALSILPELGALAEALSSRQVEILDRELQARIEAAGVAEETEKERLTNELEAAKAAGDTELATEKANDLARLKLTEEFEKKKAEVIYKGAIVSWGLSLTSAIIDGAVGVAKTISSVPFPYNIPLAALQGGLAATQIGIIAANKPTPAFAQGGSFLTSGTQDITVGDNAGGVERVTVEPVSSVGANQNQGIGTNNTMVLNIDGQQFTGWLQDQLDNGELRVPRRLVV